MNDREAIQEWFKSKSLSELYNPVKTSQLISEIYNSYHFETTKEKIFDILDPISGDLIYKLFENPRGHKGRNRPHCLYAFSKDYIGIDQEDCIRNALKIYLKNKGYNLEEEINFIDLIAEKEDQCWVFEIKGKQTYEFTNYAFAQGLEQCFPLDIDERLFKIRKSIGFGTSRNIKGQLYKYPVKNHKHIVIIVPGFSPTIVWKNSYDQKINEKIFHREVEEIKKYIEGNKTYTAFAKYLAKLDEQFNIVKYYNNCSLDWCFHILEFRGFRNGIDFSIIDTIDGSNFNGLF
ncbi:hypothetical protein ES705_00641 [subsurface metagenome]|nr:hypothetical protein [Clostridia bacterium]